MVSGCELDALYELILAVVNYDCPKSIDEYVHRIGRTARIGNMGLATTFYNENDAELGPHLVKVLLENGQLVPDFLEEFRPEGDKLNFEGDEEDLIEAGGDSGW